MGDQRREHDTESETEASLPYTPPEQSATARLDVTGTQVCASTLASVSAAVVASFFGVAGTIVGTAVMSIVATAGGAIYSHGIHKTGAKLQQTQAARLAHPLGRRLLPGATRDISSSDAAGALAPAPSSPSAARRAPGPDRSPSGWKHWKEWLSQRRWGLAAGVAIVFGASLATVTLIELAGQQPLASISGNEPSGSTSIGSLFDDGSQDTPDDTPGTTAEPSGSSTSTDSDEPSETPEQPTTTSSESTATTEPTETTPLTIEE